MGGELIMQRLQSAEKVISAREDVLEIYAMWASRNHFDSLKIRSSGP